MLQYFENEEGLSIKLLLSDEFNFATLKICCHLASQPMSISRRRTMPRRA